MQELRPYQKEALNKLREKICRSKKILLVLATGSGKTTIAASITANAIKKGKKVLFIAHRKELIFQARARFRQFGLQSGIIMSGHDTYGHVLNIASVHTLAKRRHPAADIVIIDEAHHAVSNSYKKIIELYADKIIIGLTATPYRLDGKPLGDIYEDFLQPVTVKELIEQEYIVNAKYYVPKEQINTTGVKKTGGDFNVGELFNQADKKAIYSGVVNNYKKFCLHKKAIVFCINVEHSIQSKKAFCQEGIRAEHIDANTKQEERARILSGFRDGEYDVLTNCQILTEGFDLPEIAGVIINRATTSKALYFQMCGRALRPHVDKSHAVIIDHGGNVIRHGMVDQDLNISLTGKISSGQGEAPLKICPGCEVILAAGCIQCPECGHLFKKEKSLKVSEFEEIVQIPGRLRKPWRMMDKNELYEYAAMRGYKPGWVYYQLKLRRGR